ncbi:KH domain-containing, RNA-binding, signal transduction-associated protein 2 isoform X1 [Amyelois transitella]|uniref:KH domain-containing, RNA-binding, signal transduction-associated protein 2 isoform X1 n=2 Tax=Amyelois transitella TaxID=680683 RepID=UPI0029903921|nr:KH domain-containing, RNA-binding, signal transduction-associated protein 2 isoform X1 [Amyelois transitella]XP_060807249.1 KH domain-containing, RNA-binding, signal transduction-associated protein 2 isoform X1 [Amyelois transitella]XP_060807250.1 KH domain-containing, RNA-binding, signal transduction-associated protein 2 isoform X1 [Amyelois transitella]XP_060807251.1 KH domain-containing, RNA-binding, signal transduction-associated protein 2 isoform X1 [Amyelois transitella]XP_060807252.1 
MESSALPLEVDEEGRPPQGSSTGSGSSSGTGYYGHKNGEWRGERRMLDITRDKPVKVCVRVVVPVRDHPKFNFVGKLLGPKGNSLKRLQEDTMCKMAVLGRGSMKDRQKEEELRVSGDPKFAHLSDELHVEISAFATPAEAHARIAYALAELRRFLVPDYNDDIRQEQMLEMQILSSQTEQRRLTPPDSSRSGSEEALPMRDTQKHRLPGVQPSPAPAIPGGMTISHGNARDFSPPAPTPAPDHLAAHHQLAAGHTGMLVGGGVLQQPPHHILTQNSILGGGDLLGLGSPVLGGVLHAHPALRGVKPATVHALATQGAAGAAAASAARKRPLLGGARAAMSPTKRAVMTLLARARAATHKHAPAWTAPHEHAALLPLIRDEFVTGVGVNINLA